MPSAEWAHLLRSVVTRGALYQWPEGRDVARVMGARGRHRGGECGMQTGPG